MKWTTAHVSLFFVLLLAVSLTFGSSASSARSTVKGRSHCLTHHPGATHYCKAVSQRKTIRALRRAERREAHRAGVAFGGRIHPLSWRLRSLEHANRWHRHQLKHFQAMPDWLPSDPVALAKLLAARRGWTGYEWDALYSLWMKESSFQTSDPNSLGCDGIPQACPASKMGAGWEGNAYKQIEWGLGYIASSYGRPSAAWAHSRATDPGGWY